MPLPSNWTDLDVLALSYLKSMSSVLMRQVIDASSSLDDAFRAPPSAAFRRLSQSTLFSQNPEEIVDALRTRAHEQQSRCAANGTRVVHWLADEYPKSLRTLEYPPALLFVRGEVLRNDPQVAIVGTRQCTSYGRSVAETFARDCGTAGVRIVSGLANGIDAIAHEASLGTKGGTTAVLACGTDTTGPHNARVLAHSILDNGGSLVSEYPCGTRAIPPYFPQRDRIISGLASAIVVVESAMRGGSLITAQFAIDQGRTLLAVPGSIFSSQSSGCNDLIRRSLAKPALSSADLLSSLGLVQNKEHQLETAQQHEFASVLEETIYALLSAGPQHSDALAEAADTSINELLVCLLSMEFKGMIRQSAGKMYQRC